MDSKVKRLENKIKGACLNDKPRMAKQLPDDENGDGHTVEMWYP